MTEKPNEPADDGRGKQHSSPGVMAIEGAAASEARPDANDNNEKRSDWPSRIAMVSAAAAAFGAVVAAGQAFVEVVRGHYQQQIAMEKAKQELVINREKSAQEIKLNQQKSDGALASDFLKLINDKETSDAKRIFLLEALAALASHPLQAWAETQRANIEKNLIALNKARERQLSAFDEKNEAERNVQSLQADIETMTVQIEIYRADIDKTNELHRQRRDLRRQLAFAKGIAAVAETKVVIAASPNAAPPADVALVKFQLPIEKIKVALNLPKESDIFDRYMPFVASGLVEFRLTEKKMAAAIIATAAVETQLFSVVTETGSGERWEGRKDLENTEPGDGAKYKGRGLIQFVGRVNYERYGRKLGVNLVDFPDDANEPDIAARVLCAYFKDREARFSTALEKSDLIQVRKLVHGGSGGVEQFRRAYFDVLGVL